MTQTTDQQIAAATELVSNVLKIASTDCGAPFEQDAIEALRIIYEARPADYQRIRVAFKQANSDISLLNLDRLVRQASAASAVVAATHHGYASNVLSELTFGEWRPVAFEGNLYRVDPDSNLWRKVSFDDIVHLVTGNHDAKDNCERGSDYRAIAQHAISLATDDRFFTDAPTGVATPDGFYQIIGNKLEVVPLTPDHRQRVMIAVAPRQMPTPLFDAFLHETFRSQIPEEETQQIGLIQEVTGAVMTGIAHKYQKAIKYYDPFGRAGKGTLERIQRQLVPSAFHASVSPFRWDSEYYLATLAGARLNVVGELPDDKAIPAAAFKTVTGGDLLTGRHPTHRPFSFKSQAAHIFMSNHLINTTDHSEAFFARWIIVEFPNSRLVSGLPLDPGLPDKIIEAELPGIAYWALQGAARLVENQRYSSSQAHDRLMGQWRRRTNSLDEFIFECCDLGEELNVKRSSFYQAYVIWCKDGGRKPFSKSKVKDLLTHNLVHGIRHSVLDGYEVFRGVRVREGAIDLPTFSPFGQAEKFTKIDEVGKGDF